MYNKLSFYQDRDRLGTNIIGELQKEIRVFSEEIEFEVLEEDEEELPPAAAAAAAAVGFAGAASAGVVRALQRSLLPRGQRSVYRELARLHCAIVAKRQHARTPYIETYAYMYYLTR